MRTGLFVDLETVTCTQKRQTIMPRGNSFQIAPYSRRRQFVQVSFDQLTYVTADIHGHDEHRSLTALSCNANGLLDRIHKLLSDARVERQATASWYLANAVENGFLRVGRRETEFFAERATEMRR